MNTETREIRQADRLSDDEKESGKWIPAAKKYRNRTRVSVAEAARIVEANARRLHIDRIRRDRKNKLAKKSRARNRRK